MGTTQDSIDQAIDNLTMETFNSLEHGEEIGLNDTYSIYRYSEEDHYTIREIATNEEILVVQTAGANEFEFTSLV